MLMSEDQTQTSSNDAQYIEHVSLSIREQQALSEILVSSKSFTGITKKRLMKALRSNSEGAFDLFFRKANQILGSALKVVYDEESDRCIALTKANANWVQEMLEDRHLALLLFCFYLGMTSRSGMITLDELHLHFQRSALHAERKLISALDHLVKCGFLRQEELQGETEEVKRMYSLTAMAKKAFPTRYLLRITSESQGGEVSMEQVSSFFGLDKTGPVEEEQYKLF
jgi:DNA-binding phage protein